MKNTFTLFNLVKLSFVMSSLGILLIFSIDLLNGHGSKGANDSPSTITQTDKNSNQSLKPTEQSSQSNGSSTSTSGCNGNSCSLAEVRLHNTKTDCWTIVEQKIYFIDAKFLDTTHSSNLGGPTLRTSQVCGNDITRVFNQKHQNGNRSIGGVNALEWLELDGNKLIGDLLN